jgi:SAM-dependent methyltransferase
MADVNKRVEGLSPERQKLLELLKSKAAGASRSNGAEAEDTAASAQADERLRLDYTISADQSKENFRKFYNEVSRQLDSTPFGSFSYFLNYGYVANESPQFSVVDLPEKYINRNSVKLVLELVGDCDLTGKRILDVGCGRGGTIHVINQFFKPATTTGLDLSANAIQFCRKAHRYPGVTFREGDAEKLPFEDSSFDIVTNVESSHSYPNVRNFYLEVSRVLSPGGYFLYTDVMQRDKSNQGIGILQSLGLEVERDQDITGNVLQSCDEIAMSRVQAFASKNDAGLMQNFLAAPGSQVYEEMKSGAWIYRILRLRKGPPA